MVALLACLFFLNLAVVVVASFCFCTLLSVFHVTARKITRVIFCNARKSNWLTGNNLFGAITAQKSSDMRWCVTWNVSHFSKTEQQTIVAKGWVTCTANKCSYTLFASASVSGSQPGGARLSMRASVNFQGAASPYPLCKLESLIN